MDNFADAIAAMNDLKREGVVSEYALGGAMALVFWSEPIATFDLDVFVLLDQTGLLISLTPIYEWAQGRGYAVESEHILIAGIPVQVLPAHNDLAAEAVERAADLDYDNIPVRVITPEYLIAMYLEPTARSRKRLERVAALLEEAAVDLGLLDALLERYDLRLPERS